jgi:hypothetical protein
MKLESLYLKHTSRLVGDLSPLSTCISLRGCGGGEFEGEVDELGM